MYAVSLLTFRYNVITLFSFYSKFLSDSIPYNLNNGFKILINKYVIEIMTFLLNTWYILINHQTLKYLKTVNTDAVGFIFRPID